MYSNILSFVFLGVWGWCDFWRAINLFPPTQRKYVWSQVFTIALAISVEWFMRQLGLIYNSHKLDTCEPLGLIWEIPIVEKVGFSQSGMLQWEADAPGYILILLGMISQGLGES